MKRGLLESLQSISDVLDMIEKEESIGSPEQTELPGISSLISTSPAQSLLTGKQIALIPGHEPGGGAEGERDWNIDVALHMDVALRNLGADPMIYYHTTRSYSQRMIEMSKAIKKEQPNNWACVELHYDAVDIPGPSGHHFQYLGSKLLAECFRDVWQVKYPNSRPRRDDGIMHNTQDNGAGFLRQAPGWAVLCEPFFHSNRAELAYYQGKQKEVAYVYVKALKLFAERSA